MENLVLFFGVVWILLSLGSFFIITLVLRKVLFGEVKLLQNIHLSETNVLKKLEHLIQGQRLSIILKLEPTSLRVSPEIFEANKPKVLARLFAALENEQHPQPSTLAFCILQHSGFGDFVDGKTFETAKTALARLIVNEDKNGARKFLEELVDKL